MKTKKILTIISLISAVSCGSGGGGGSSSTSSATATAPSTSATTSNVAPAVQQSNPLPAVKNEQNPNLVKNVQYDSEYSTYGSGNYSVSVSSTPFSRTLPVHGTLENSRFNSENKINWNSSERRYNPSNPDNAPVSTAYTGTGVKVGITDGGFNNESNWNAARSITRNVERLGTPNNSSSNTHGVDVLATSVLNAPNADYVILDSSAGATSVYADARYYKRMIDYGVRIFNNSFGHVETHNNARSVLGSDVYEVLKEGINKGALFVWSGGNVPSSVIPGKNGNLPRLDPSFEKGWLNVIGIVPKDFSNNFNFDNLMPLSPAGSSKYWSLSALGYIKRDNGDIQSGSSSAAPTVSGAAAAIKSKYSFMNGDLLRQTILSTATDIGDPGADDIYGWGLLDLEKALKGPALFDRKLALGDKVNIQLDGGNYSFDNNISGDAGLNLTGTGTLTLNGINTYTGETTIGSGAYLKIRKVSGSRTVLSNGARLELENATVSEVVSNGTVINSGNSAIGNFTTTENAETITDINGTLTTENANLNGKIVVTNEKGEYFTKEGTEKTIITGNVTNNAEIKTSSELLNANSETNEIGVQATVSRKDVVKYAKSNSFSEQQVNTAEQIEKTLENVDSLYSQKMASSQTLSNGAQLQSLNATTLDTMSGQIYGSAQALTFEQSEIINRNLSNRMAGLSRSLENDSKYGFWFSGIFSKGEISTSGYAKGRTAVTGGQVGFDMKLNENAVLGISADYSKGKVKFNKYNGQSKADMTGISVYGRQNLGNAYVSGRLGLGYSDTDVERDIIVNSNIAEHSKVTHNDKSVSAYFETGYSIKNKNGDFAFTPYVALGTDRVTRGKFSEENTNFGMTADKKKYNMPYATIGARAVKRIGKTDITGYAEYSKGLKEEDLNFKASYNFARNANFDVKGINYSKNKVNAGIEVNTEIKKGLNWYANYDYKHSTDHSKSDNHMVTTGIRVEF